MIELPDEVAVVVLDCIASMEGPQDPMRVAYSFREARYLLPKLVEAFEAAGIDPEGIVRPELPLLKVGRLAQS